MIPIVPGALEAAMNILETILAAQNGGAVKQMGQQLGLGDDQASSVLSALVPALAAGFQRNTHLFDFVIQRRANRTKTDVGVDFSRYRPANGAGLKAMLQMDGVCRNHQPAGG